MPKPNPGETQDDFIKRCIPIVMEEGTAQDGAQAAAICHSFWDESQKSTAEGVRKRLDTLYAVKGSGSLNFAVKDVDTVSRTVTGFANGYNFLDSYADVLVMGAAKKSIDERGPNTNAAAKIVHALHHDLTRLVGLPTVLKETTVNGITGIYFESKLSKSQDGLDTLIKYQEKLYNQHSIGFQYKNVEIVKRDSDEWSNAVSGLINPQDADKHDAIYMVKEIALFEFSTVAIGANTLTPALGIKAGDKNMTMLALQYRIDAMMACSKNRGMSEKGAQELELHALQIKQIMNELMEAQESEDIRGALAAQAEKNKGKNLQAKDIWSIIAGGYE